MEPVKIEGVSTLGSPAMVPVEKNGKFGAPNSPKVGPIYRL